MMRFTVLLLLPVLFVFSGCEKDDICSDTTPTTPRLVIEFYDVSNLTQTKNVSNLVLKANGVSETLSFNGVSKIYVPFDTTLDTAQFELIQNGGDNDTTNDNIDIITMNYTRTTQYVSRACGYKLNFVLNPTNGFSFTDATPNDGLWIQTMGIYQSTITNENEVHVKLYF
ncbi:DUF6452 family protein [Flavobacterium sp.]|jgi:hypothetical protein|uniref:DUF6452 family protein n=1 Tax=Flavobacterium sp. TaxID=239 RepID=UPI0022C6A806|nr:DUF6452 family protein [Flavobacterium sp.]MCZ8143720.1 DUF6452 family protein [Flavobacterium sp.]MCZ8366983.1 DUF6452 family protein [Flavobacterium sp.]